MRSLTVTLVSLLCSLQVAHNAGGQAIYEPQRVTTIAGIPGVQGSFDSGVTSRATFDFPEGLAVDAAGNVYVADTANYTIRKISPSGATTTLAGAPNVNGYADGTGGAARFGHPRAVAVDSAGNVYVADFWTIRKISPAGAVTTLAGSPYEEGFQDGFGAAARFSYSEGIAVDSSGTVYVADTGNDSIRKISPDGYVTTLAGMPRTNWGSIDGTGKEAWFARPTGIAVATNRDLFVTDYTSGAIRKITPDAVVTTIAGPYLVWGSSNYRDGPINRSQFNGPTGIALNEKAGVIYIADTRNHAIRKISGNRVTTIAGGLIRYSDYDDGIGAAAFVVPRGLAVGPGGTLYIADLTASTIRSSQPRTIPQPLNLSTRLRVQSGENVMIGGFVVKNQVPKKVLIRAIGPSLDQSGIGSALSDPTLELYDPAGRLLATNDDWKSSQRSEIEASGAAPFSEVESAIVATVNPLWGYTAIVRGKGGSSGVALVEVYDLESTKGSVLGNISTRGFVDTGENVMIGGFIIGPAANGATPMMMRALGPSLEAAGVQGVLQDPSLELRNAEGTLVSSNNDYEVDPQQEVDFPSYLRPKHEQESLLSLELRAGTYTAIVRGNGSTSGVALLEVYNLN